MITTSISILHKLQMSLLRCHPPLRFEYGYRSASSVSSCRIFSNEDIKTFAKLSGDMNHIHLEPEKDSKFDKPIVHGTLILGHVSGLIAKEFSGALLYKVEATFKAPLYVDEEINITVTPTKLDRSLLHMSLSGSTEKKLVFVGNVEVAVTKYQIRVLRSLIQNNK